VTEDSFRLPPFDAGIKAQLDAQREQLEALGNGHVPKLPPAELEFLRRARRVALPFSPKAHEMRTTLAILRQDIADREKDLAGRKDSLRKFEGYAERKYDIPVPRPVLFKPPIVDLPTAKPPAGATNDNAAAPAPAPSEPEPQRLRGRLPKYDYLWIGAAIARYLFNPSWRFVASENTSEIAAVVLGWYELQFKRQPPENSMREAVGQVCDQLRRDPEQASGKKPR
jgi:hypothetical protein